MSITTVITDLGGVIVSVHKERLAEGLSKYTDVSAEEIEKNFSSTTLTDFDLDLNLGLITPKQFFDRCVREFRLKRIDFETFKRVYSDIFDLIEGTAEILKEQAKKRKIVLLSNTDAIHYAFYSKKYKDVFDLFYAQATSFGVHARKPDRKIYLEALRMAGEKPENCVYIDDIKEYADAATKLGIHGIHFKSPEQLRAELKKLD
ncbi:HAD family phosphatase [Candidatus Woesearchaeota archaeon]|nr:HAD family phosphatase [Candidatus Woesearchaeota archaeon]